MKIIVTVIAFLVFSTPWIWNLVKLTKCDFKSDYRCEVIHTAGFVVPPLSIVTVWIADDSGELK